MSKSFDKLANSFHKAEQNLQITGPGVGGYDVGHDMKPVLGLKKPQTPAQHASVEKAGRTSAAKRKAGAGFGKAGGGFGKPGSKVFGF